MSRTFRRNVSTAFQTALALGTTYQLPVSPRRVSMKIKNGAGGLNLVFGGEASQTFGYPMDVNEKLEWDYEEGCPKDSVSFFCTTATTLSVIVTVEPTDE